jgi:hypothetical protein
MEHLQRILAVAITATSIYTALFTGAEARTPVCNENSNIGWMAKCQSGPPPEKPKSREVYLDQARKEYQQKYERNEELTYLPTLTQKDWYEVKMRAKELQQTAKKEYAAYMAKINNKKEREYASRNTERKRVETSKRRKQSPQIRIAKNAETAQRMRDYCKRDFLANMFDSRCSRTASIQKRRI